VALVGTLASAGLPVEDLAPGTPSDGAFHTCTPTAAEIVWGSARTYATS
jgi:hypothetical protein